MNPEHGPILPPVLAADRWATNGDLIADAARLYPPGPTAVDATYNRGGFWTRYRPPNLICHDIDPAFGDGVDFRRLPEPTGSVDLLVLDPPYVAPGGRTTSTLNGDMHSRYGMHTTAATPDAQWDIILAGINEAHRVLRPGGQLWLKVMDYVTSGKQHWYATRHGPNRLDTDGYRLIDRFAYTGGTGPQPHRNRDGSLRRQVHARNNLSYLLIAEAVPRPHQGQLPV